MTKFIIPIIITVILIAGIGGFFIFQKPAFPEQFKEGIGTLPESVSEAVKQKQSLKSQEQINWDSPFGFFNPYEILISDPGASTHSDINNYLRDLGVKWIQPMPRVVNGISDIEEALKADINLYSRALPIGRIERSDSNCRN